MRQKIIILKINKSGRRDERVGQKDDTFSIVGVPMGVARRGGVSSSSSTRWGVWGVGGEGGWLFQRGVWARVLGGSMGEWGVGFHQQ